MINYNTLEEFANDHKPGEIMAVTVKKLVDFGLFVDLGIDVDGVVHISDVSWQNDQQQVVSKIRVGAKIDAKILSIDTSKRRIALGIKQVENDYLEEFLSQAGVNDVLPNCVIVGYWNSKLELEVPQCKSIFLIGGPDLPSDFEENKNGRYSKGRLVDCQVVSLDKENRRLALRVLDDPK